MIMRQHSTSAFGVCLLALGAVVLAAPRAAAITVGVNAYIKAS